MFRENIKALRNELNYTQEEFARALNRTQSTVSDWETGRSEPDLNDLKKIATVYGVNINYLLDLTDEWGNTTDIQKSPAELPADKKELLSVYDSLSPARKQDVLTLVKSFASADASKK